MKQTLILIFSLLATSPALASNHDAAVLDLTHSWVGFAAIALFIGAYVLVILEERLHLRKSKPVLLAAGLIWVLIALFYNAHDMPHVVESGIRFYFLEYAELFFFLLVAMTYINAMLERGVFAALRHWLVAKKFSYRTLFWLTGILTFFISPIADNLTTALVMFAIVLAVGDGKPTFITLAAINIVVAANAGGAFSPFGDITTLMVWQKGMIQFWEFFSLFIPAVVNFLLPACIMQFALPTGNPPAITADKDVIKPGGLTIVSLFLLTILTAVSFHNILHIPAVFGMMTGLAYLKFYSFYLLRKSKIWARNAEHLPGSIDNGRNRHPENFFKQPEATPLLQ